MPICPVIDVRCNGAGVAIGAAVRYDVVFPIVSEGRSNKMPTRNANAAWNGNLKEGKGEFKVGSGAFGGNYSFGTRFEEAPGTNPEELIGAAHSGCFSMALAGILGRAGHNPQSIRTQAKVHLEKVGEGFKITRIVLDTEGQVPGIDENTFREHAEKAKAGCPVSQALAGVQIELNARLAK
jgi:lipoyl-dependent peroxiredoxin